MTKEEIKEKIDQVINDLTSATFSSYSNDLSEAVFNSLNKLSELSEELIDDISTNEERV